MEIILKVGKLKKGIMLIIKICQMKIEKEKRIYKKLLL